MHIDVVELQRQDLELVQRIDERVMYEAEWRRYEDIARREMVVSMRCAIYGKPHPEKARVIRYPADWWQSLKERFAPAWFRDRYPVKFTEVSFGLNELYPDIKPTIPGKHPVWKVAIKEGVRDDLYW